MNSRKISITAEFVSIMRAEKDPKNLFFVSERSKKIFRFIEKIISKKKTKEIFDWRLQLSEDFDRKILADSYDQIIELAAGYSLRGFNLCLANESIIYVDTDFEDVISRKKEILEDICEKEGIVFPANYFLVGVDVLKDDIFGKIQGVVSGNKKTIIMAEGLTSYFSEAEFGRFIENIRDLLSNFSDGEFFSHENIKKPSKGIIYFLLRKVFLPLMTRTKGSRAFETTEKFEKYLKDKKVNKFKMNLDERNRLLYSIYS